MSIKYLNYAFQQREFSSMEKLIMIALCDCVNDDGFGYPGYDTLIKKTSMAKSTLSKHLNTLKDAELIETNSHGSIGKGRKVNTYQITKFWLIDDLKVRLETARKNRKVRGIDLSLKATDKSNPHTDTISPTLEPRKVQPSNPISSTLVHEPSVGTISKEPSVLKKQVKKEMYKGFEVNTFNGQFSTAIIKEFIFYKSPIKPKITPEGFERTLKKAINHADRLKIKPDEILKHTIESGWKGVGNFDWYQKSFGEQNATHKQNRKESNFERHEREVRELLEA